MTIKDNYLYVGGLFTSVEDVPATNIAGCDLNSGQWSDLGFTEEARGINAVVLDSLNNVYVGTYGGDGAGFIGTYTPDPKLLMKWNGISWSGIGGGLVYNNSDMLPTGVTALAADGTNIYAGGKFAGCYVNGDFVASHSLIEWTGNNWVPMSGVYAPGVSDPVTEQDHTLVCSLAISGTNLFASGYFVAPSWGIARISTETGAIIPIESLYSDCSDPLWPGGCNPGYPVWPSVAYLVLHEGELYVSGDFSRIGDPASGSGSSARGIAKWNGSWSALSTGLSYQDLAIGGDSFLAANENAVFVGGIFDSAGGLTIPAFSGSENIARWVTDGDIQCPSGHRIAAGFGHSLAARSDGTVWSWGANSAGQLGNGTTTQQLRPVEITALDGVVAVAAGNAHSVALRYDGTVWTWGANNLGQLGIGNTTNSRLPGKVSALSRIVAISAGQSSTYALQDTGEVWACGANDAGQLGDGTGVRQLTPVHVHDLTGVAYISSGPAANHCLAVKSNTTVWSWGNNQRGQLGDGSTITRSTPVAVAGLTGAISASAGGFFSLVGKSDGKVWAFGDNSYKQLGSPAISSYTAYPVPVISSSGGLLTGVSSISCGNGSSYALKTDASIWVWGNNTYGQLGDGTTTTRATATLIGSLTPAVDVAAGFFFALGVEQNLSLRAWGANDFGQLGDDTTMTRLTPVPLYNGFGL